MIEQPVPIEPRNVPITVRDAKGETVELVLIVSERGAAWAVSWVELPAEGTA